MRRSRQSHATSYCRGGRNRRIFPRRMDSQDTPSETAQLLAQRSYLLFIGARFAATLGVQIQAVTIGWQVYQLARGGRTVNEAAFILSMIGLIQFLPVL